MRKALLKERFDWALSIIQPAPSDIILEIGCGSGILVERMVPSITTGKIIGVDRSESMIQSAQKRNRQSEGQGLVQLIQEDYGYVYFDDQLFDKVVAFNVSVFWQDPGNYLPQVKKHLKHGGQFFLFNQPPFDKTKSLALMAEDVLKRNDFKIKEVIIQKMEPAPSFCIISTPAVM